MTSNRSFSPVFLYALLAISGMSLIYVLTASNDNPANNPIATISPRTQVAQVADVTSGLVGWWKFDEGSGTSAGDSSGSGLSMTLSGSSWTVGEVGSGAISFSGSIGSYGRTTASVAVPTDGFSFSFWIKTPTSANETSAIVSWADQRFCRFGGVSANTINCSVTGSSAGSAVSSSALNDGQWHNVVYTSTASTQQMYVDGVLQSSKAQTTSTIGGIVTAGAFSGSAGINGYLDDLRLYSRALTSDEVTTLYTGGGSVTSPAVINGSCSTTVNACMAGTLQDIADSGIQYLWNCTGSNGGTTASCSLPISQQGDTTPPTTSSIQAASITQTGATITWTTNESSDSQVEYGLTTSYGSNTSLNITLSTSHSQALSSLSANTLYHYRVKSKDVSNNLTTSPDQTFTTLSAVSLGPQTYNVKQDGTGDFTTIQACANVAKAGDMCLVYPGTYTEHVVTKAGGTDDSHRITFKANGTVTMQGFDLKHSYVTVDGFDMTGYYVSSYVGLVDVWQNANYADIVNNTMRENDGVHQVYGVKFESVSGVSATNAIIRGNTMARLNAQYFLLYGTNHLIEQNTMTEAHQWDAFYIFGTGHIIRHNVFLNAGAPAGGNHPDYFQTFSGSGIPAEHILIEDNWIQDLPDQLCQLNSSVNGVGDLVTNVDDFTFRGNVVVNVPSNCNMDIPNTTWDNNTFYRLSYNAIGIIMGGSLTRGNGASAKFHNNVFLGGGSSSLSANGTNGFYSIDGFLFTREVIAFYVTNEDSGGCPSSCPIATGIADDMISHGYIDGYTNGHISATAKTLSTINDMQLSATYSAYKPALWSKFQESISYDNTLRSSFSADYNYVAGAPSAGYPAKKSSGCVAGTTFTSSNFCEPHGINGGNPMLKNVNDPLGPDGIPFTADDGLQPVTGSPLCGHGLGGLDIGAYACTGGSVTSPVTNNYAITVAKMGSGQGSITCGGLTCPTSASAGTQLVFTATPANGSSFTGWSGSCSGVSLTCTVSVSGDVSATATFDAQATGSTDPILHLDFSSPWSSSETVSDTSNNGNNATCQTAYSLSGSTFNQCASQTSGPATGTHGASLSGSVCRLDSDYFAVQKSSSIGSLSQGTISIWLNYNPTTDSNFSIPNTSFTYQRALDSVNNGLAGTWMLGKNSYNNTQFSIQDPNKLSTLPHDGYNDAIAVSFPDANPSGYNPVTGSWHLYTVSWDGTNIYGYYDGVLFQTSSQAGIGPLSIGNYLTVGALNHGDPQNALTSNCLNYYAASVANYGYPANQQYVMPNAGFFVGKMSDIRIYNRTLSASEVANLYNTTGGSGAVVTNPPSSTPDTTPPTVSLTSPVSGTTVTPSSITLTANASDPTVTGQTTSGVAGVQFKVNGTNLGNEVTTAPYSIIWNASSLPDGSYTLTAIARDGAGYTTTSSAVTITLHTVAATDSDHDGVPDVTDLCPNTPTGVTVNTLGCPLPKATKFTTTNLSSLNLNSVQDFTIENTLGKITFDHATTPYSLITSAGAPLDLDTNVNITRTDISLDSNMMSQFNNRPATLTFKNVNLSVASLAAIKQDNGPCTGCTFVSYNKPVLTIKVPHFTSFSVIEDDTSPTLPIITTVATSSVTSTSATITWTTDVPSDSVVDYGATVSYISEASSTTAVTSHSVNITSLTPSTLYHFTVLSTDTSGNTGTTGDYTFMTATSPVTDLCPNIDGVQASIPSGMILSGGNCVTQSSGGGGGSSGGSSGSSGGSSIQTAIVTPGGTSTTYVNPLLLNVTQATSTPTCTTITSSAYTFTRELTLGSTGFDVKALQQFLNTHGYTVSTTGAGSKGYESTYFGTLTRQALAKYQSANHITPSVGYFGPLTRTSIQPQIIGGTSQVCPTSLSQGSSYVGQATPSSVICPPGLICTPKATTVDCPPNMICTPNTTTSTSILPAPSSQLQSSIPSSFTFTHQIHVNTTDPDVIYLQMFLNSHGYTVATTGPGSPGNESTFFGPATISALARFQSANGITPAYGNFGMTTAGVANQNMGR